MNAVSDMAIFTIYVYSTFQLNIYNLKCHMNLI